MTKLEKGLIDCNICNGDLFNNKKETITIYFKKWLTIYDKKINIEYRCICKKCKGVGKIDWIDDLVENKLPESKKHIYVVIDLKKKLIFKYSGCSPIISNHNIIPYEPASFLFQNHLDKVSKTNHFILYDITLHYGDMVTVFNDVKNKYDITLLYKNTRFFYL